MPPFPDNLNILHSEEENIRNKSINSIETDHDKSRHIAVVEICMDLLNYIRIYYDHWDEDQLIVKLLGASIFNSCGSAVGLMLSGYYQSSGLQIRYILETGWLLEYLSTDPDLVQKWKFTKEEKRQNVFSPGMIRRKLDERDNFTEKKRDAHYKRLCVLCGHPTFAGNAMLRPQPGADANMGPFFESSLLNMCIQEIVMVAVTALDAFLWYFPPVSVPDHRAIRRFEAEKADWIEAVFDRRLSRARLKEIDRAIFVLEHYSQ